MQKGHGNFSVNILHFAIRSPRAGKDCLSQAYHSIFKQKNNHDKIFFSKPRQRLKNNAIAVIKKVKIVTAKIKPKKIKNLVYSFGSIFL